MTSGVDWILSVNHLDAREWINGLWFSVSFAMCVEFGRVLVKRIHKYRSRWRDDLGIKAIAALFFYFLGESLIRGWVWLLLALQSEGYKELSIHVRDDFYVAFIAAFISTWAAMCCLYVFSANHWAWMRAATIVVMLFLMMNILL